MFVAEKLIISSAFSDPAVLSGFTQRSPSKQSPLGVTFAPSPPIHRQNSTDGVSKLAMALGVDSGSIHMVSQVHGNTVVVVERGSPVSPADAMISNQVGLILGVRVADCAGVLLHDSVKNVVAAVHSGWRGTQLEISSVTLRMMTQVFGSAAKDVTAYVGPTAKACCYEVDWDVARHFQAFCTKESRSGIEKWKFDNSKAIKHQLLCSGVPEIAISVHEACTICSLDFHSHRRDAELSGRGLAFIGLR